MTCMVANYMHNSRLSSFSDGANRVAVPPPAEGTSCCLQKGSAEGGSADEEGRKSLSTAIAAGFCSSLPREQVAAIPVEAASAGLSSCCHELGKLKSRTACLPKPWWEGQLAEAIHGTLKEREKMLETLKLASPQLHKRAGLIDFITNVCKCLPFSDTTRHLAVLLLDHFMEKHSIMEYRLKLVGLTCLLVAAKMEDRDDHLPSIGQLRHLAKLENLAEYSKDNFQRMELYLMKFFDWSISYPTAAHFIGYYNATCYHQDDLGDNLSLPGLPFCLGDAVSEMDLLDIVTTDLDLLTPMDSLSNCELEDISEMELTTPTLRDFLSLRYQLEEITASLLEKALRDYRFLRYPPSVVAAAAVCVARIYMKVSPVWTARLEAVSCCSKKLLNPVVELLVCQNYT